MSGTTVTATLHGGSQFEQKLNELAAKLSGNPSVRVGFLEGATYPDGTSVPYIAALNEFGGTFTVPARKQTIYRKVDKHGNFLRKGRFVKRKAANFESTHDVAAHQRTQPPRPFFRRMIAAKKAEWGPALGVQLKKTDYDARRSLDVIGAGIAGQLRQSIVDLVDPPLAPSTIAAKSRGKVNKVAGVLGPAKPLVWTGHMLQSVDHEVVDG